MPRPTLLRTLGFGVAFLVAGFVGRTTLFDATATALIWPAAGVAFLWLLATPATPRWERPLACAAIGAVSFLVNRSTGSETPMALVFLVVNVLQPVLAVHLCERAWKRWPRVRWEAPFSSPGSLLRLVAAAGLGCIPSAVLGVTAQYFLFPDVASLPSALTWWARNTVGIVGFASAGLVAADVLRGRRSATTATGSPLEGVLLVGATIALAEVDLRIDDLPLVVFLPAMAVWAGMRFPPVFVALHSLLAGAAAIWITLVGEGPFRPVDSAQVAALSAQLFVGMTVLVGLFLAMSRQENAQLTEDVRSARDDSQRQAELLRTVIMSMHDPVVVVDHRDRVTMVNRAATRTLFVADASPIGALLTTLQLTRPDGSVIPFQEHPCRMALAGGVHRVDVDVAGQPESTIHRVTATPLSSRPDGTPTGAVLVYHDVTEDRAQQEALSSFASTVAHDLLNPISAISAWSELMREDLADSGQDLEALERIEASTQQMRELVDGLLADARAREFSLSTEVVDLGEVARDAARGVPGAEVEVQELPPVLGDPMLLRQVLVNLVGNAVKYAAADRDPAITVTGDHDDLGDVVVRVADRGMGIPPDHLDSVFEPFRRVPGTQRRGTGLGLAICRRIVERHGGRIVARPRDDGPGTVMELTLPAAPVDARVSR
ncbi:MAG: hypothetical protein AVDCRST_MAG32-2531 [uncultured Nocardioides sp.]|uniref:Sensor-like histidine kinase SenX3 n=1 Tax=uncultured Nocardioides sp. TaxID=198441 RepID=A0A6J4NWQ3_9ACTN|nr:MAG: hypothetical protein AVDCRST_MAG32-2531 [uncultured Nocardioides sp.]